MHMYIVLPGLSGTLQPRVRAAVLRTWWNGWVTKRRMQDRSKGCIFGCTSEDSIEHYACCSTVREFGQRSLGLDSPTPETAMEDFLALTPTLSSVTKELVARKAVRLASVYFVHCKARHNRPVHQTDGDMAYTLHVCPSSCLCLYCCLTVAVVLLC